MHAVSFTDFMYCRCTAYNHCYWPHCASTDTDHSDNQVNFSMHGKQDEENHCAQFPLLLSGIRTRTPTILLNDIICIMIFIIMR